MALDLWTVAMAAMAAMVVVTMVAITVVMEAITAAMEVAIWVAIEQYNFRSQLPIVYYFCRIPESYHTSAHTHDKDTESVLA